MSRILPIFLLFALSYPDRGDIISTQVVSTKDIDNNQLYIENELSVLASGDFFNLTVEYGYWMYNITYETIDKYGISNEYRKPVIAGDIHEGLLRDNDAIEYLLDVDESKRQLMKTKNGKKADHIIPISEIFLSPFLRFFFNVSFFSNIAANAATPSIFPK